MPTNDFQEICVGVYIEIKVVYVIFVIADPNIERFINTFKVMVATIGFM